MLLTEKLWLSVENYWNNRLQYSAFLMQNDHHANSNYLAKKKKASGLAEKSIIQISILWCWVGTTLCNSISYFQGNLAWKCCLKILYNNFEIKKYSEISPFVVTSDQTVYQLVQGNFKALSPWDSVW